MSSKFKVGDKAVFVGSYDIWHRLNPGTVLTIKAHYVSIGGFDCWYVDEVRAGIMETELELEEVYNSPLYKALS